MKKTSEEIRNEYRKRMILPEVQEERINLLTESGLVVANGYDRVVFGDRGPYIECRDEHMGSGIHILHNQKWRIKNPNCFYIEYRTMDECNVKIYKQKKLVDYADYLVGCWYISPFDLTSDKYPELIRKLEKR